MKNAKAEALAASKLRQAQGEGASAQAQRVERLLREKIWPQVPARVRGKQVSKAEEAETLGYGPEGC